MIRIYLFIFSFLITSTCFSQQISRYVVSSGGNYSVSSASTLSSTIGEPMINQLTTVGIVLTQGFQQATPILEEMKEDIENLKFLMGIPTKNTSTMRSE